MLLGKLRSRSGKSKSRSTKNSAAHSAIGPAALAKLFEFDCEFDRTGRADRHLRHSENGRGHGRQRYQRMIGRYQHVATLAAEAASFIRPEILAIAAAKLKKFLGAEALAAYRLQLERLRPLQAAHARPRRRKAARDAERDVRRGSNEIFRQLTDADLKFGMCKNEKGERSSCQHSSRSQSSCTRPIASVRKQAFHQYYAQFKAHETRSAATLELGAEGRLLREGPRLRQCRWPRRCFTTTCRWRSTTTSSPRSAAICRPSITTTICGGGR